MKQKVFKGIGIFFESVYLLIITYTLSSMAASFNPHWSSILFRAANIFAISKFYESIKKHTGSHFRTYVILFLNLAAFALLAWKIGYIRGEVTPFPNL